MTDVRRVDPRDADQVRTWWELSGRAQQHRPHDLRWPLPTFRASLLDEAESRNHVFLAHDGDRAVGAARAEVLLMENTHAAVVQVFVDPAARRRGTGRALLAAVESAAREEGRRTSLVDVHATLDDDGPGAAFAAAAGYRLASSEEVKALDLHAAAPGWPRAVAEAAPHHADYRLVAWRGDTPDDLVEGTCALYSRFLDEVPLGDLDLEAGHWDEARLRQDEKLDEEAGRRRFAVAALARDGEVVGFTDLYVADGATGAARIGGTLVVPEHRGHRLGTAMKLANQAQLHAAHPECAVLVTGNAGVNAPMNRVNDALGFRVVERCLEMQKVL